MQLKTEYTSLIFFFKSGRNPCLRVPIIGPGFVFLRDDV